MPLFKINIIHTHLRYLVWEITETIEELRNGITLHPSDKEKLVNINHPSKIKEFLALRQCLKMAFGENPEIFYTENGKPFTKKKDEFVSFSHTDGFATIIIGDKNVGIDIEIPKPQIIRIAPKFMRAPETKSLSKKHQVPHLLQYWGVKEVIVKIEGDKKLDFKKEIHVTPFKFREKQNTTASLIRNEQIKKYDLYFEHHAPVYITYGSKIEE